MSGKTVFGISLFLLLLTMTACSPETQQAAKPHPDQASQPRQAGISQTGQIIAVAGDKKLTYEQLDWISKRRGGIPSSPRALQRLIEYWIDIELLSQEARQLGLGNSDKAKFMADFGINEAYANALIDNIRESVKVTDRDIRNYYEETKSFSSQIKDPPRYSFSHIRTRTLEEAQDALQRIEQGENINKLAMELSVYHDAKTGGTVENLTERAVKTTYGQEFLKALQEAKAGDLIGPFKTRNDFYEVAKFQGRREERIKPLEEVKDKLRKILTYKNQNDAIQERVNALKEKTNAEILIDPTRPLEQQLELEKEPD